MTEIPVLDWSRFDAGDRAGFSADLAAACRGPGFFLLTGHGVAEDLRARVFEMADAFFSRPEGAKTPLAINAANRGWARLGSENLDDTAPGQVDSKEAFNIGLEMAADDPRVLAGEPFRAPNQWPEIPGFRETMLAYFDACHRLGVDLHRAFAADLGLPEDWFAPHFTAPLATLRLLHYPPATGADGEIGAGAHTDYGSVTLLTTDGEGGLQVKPRGGDWADVPHVPGAFTVNIGDCLMRWTNDIYVSTPHRVLPPKRQRRSLAFFLDPNPEAPIEGLPGTGDAKYPATTGAAYLRARLDATYKETT
jgi:isopenicillin N synthase-like dioxygenase